MEDLVSRISTGRCPGMKLGQRFESSPPKSSIPDPLFSRRVASGDISVVHLQDNEEEQKIAKLKLTDAGFYICRTPSTDPIMSGNYDAQVQLRGKTGRNLSEGNIPINFFQASSPHAAATTVFQPFGVLTLAVFYHT
ncbi:uncharacterized protein LOC103474902 isoform X1 [Poecilia reticulata]|uniref:uncharacterized protein LOC103474902 isoform X1 n=1 Tax=Poecilia reticulata TaxID=8081 RepID=UPI0004A266B2|nr:PREDICTED: uncharacterized protein LOC103474902 isoform X1 [Poecilia reticulata]XP_008424403.1 PREDICTED: uncharacterized protein LOC103474902 isoform X1 [Poecilia reticulata]